MEYDCANLFTRDKRLLLSDGVLRGSPRLLGIAGRRTLLEQLAKLCQLRKGGSFA